MVITNNKLTKTNLKTILVQLPAVKIAPILDLYSPSDFFGPFASFHNTARSPSISSTCLSLSFRLVNAIHVTPVTNCKFNYIIYVYNIKLQSRYARLASIAYFKNNSFC